MRVLNDYHLRRCIRQEKKSKAKESERDEEGEKYVQKKEEEEDAHLLFFSLSLCFFLFSRFQNQANPLAHHHYRLTGTRRASVPYFQYICIHSSMRKKKKKNRARIRTYIVCL